MKELMWIALIALAAAHVLGAFMKNPREPGIAKSWRLAVLYLLLLTMLLMSMVPE